MENLPLLQDINAALESAHFSVTAPEVHGLLCGFLSASYPLSETHWVDTILQASGETIDQTHEQDPLFTHLFRISAKQLQEFNFEFQMLLPDDRYPLGDRTEALGLWLQGYLAGLSLAGVQLENILANANLSVDLKETLQDVTTIASAGLSSMGDTPEDESEESAFMEISEYLRMAVLLIHNELATELNKDPTGGEPPSQSAMH